MKAHCTQVKQGLYRSKSISALDIRTDTKTSNTDVYVVDRTECQDVSDDVPRAESGLGHKSEQETLAIFERKIDRLKDLFVDQTRLLALIKEDIRVTKDYLGKTKQNHAAVFKETSNNTITQRDKALLGLKKYDSEYDTVEGMNDRAKTLLDAIELRQTAPSESDMKNILSNFLQSDDLKHYVVSAIVDSVKDMIMKTFSQDFSSIYKPLLERSHRRMMRHVTNVLEEAFVDLETKSVSRSKPTYNASRMVLSSLGHHQQMMENATYAVKSIINNIRRSVTEVLEEELHQWRKNALEMLSETVMECNPEKKWSSAVPRPPESDESKRSIIDQLMNAAVINKHIADGDINGSFKIALSATDLSLVMVACRAIEPEKVFSPICHLTQSVLLSLIQQLATDMDHDTQLKCRYLEEAVINLNRDDVATRSFLPLVAADARKHLVNFLVLYPNHVAKRQITLIIMAISNLLK